jgi:hypothetical protein
MLQRYFRHLLEQYIHRKQWMLCQYENKSELESVWLLLRFLWTTAQSVVASNCWTEDGPPFIRPHQAQFEGTLNAYPAGSLFVLIKSKRFYHCCHAVKWTLSQFAGTSFKGNSWVIWFMGMSDIFVGDVSLKPKSVRVTSNMRPPASFLLCPRHEFSIEENEIDGTCSTQMRWEMATASRDKWKDDIKKDLAE